MKNASKILKYVVYALAAFVVAFGILVNVPTPPVTVTTPKQPEKHSHKWWLDNCISSYDGAHPAIRDKVKASLSNPASFKHILTSVALDGDTIRIKMSFTADNAFGLTTAHTVTATATVNNCNIITAVLTR